MNSVVLIIYFAAAPGDCVGTFAPVVDGGAEPWLEPACTPVLGGCERSERV